MLKRTMMAFMIIIVFGTAAIGGAKTGTLSGKVTDMSGQPLIGVQVYLPKIVLGTVTGENGEYQILNIPIGTYDVEFRMIGYQNVTIKDVQIILDQTLWLNQSLKIAVIEGDAITSTSGGGRRLGWRDIGKKLFSSSKPQFTSSKTMYSEEIAVIPYGKHHRNDRQWTNQNTEEYADLNENSFKSATQNPLSTFSIDVDNASYSNVRRYLTQRHTLPPKDAVRIEEMINYFTYDYPQPEGEHPFSITTEISKCPWNKQNKLVHIGLQGKKLDYENLQRSNLVFLIDVSGSMRHDNKLPLLIKSFKLLLDELSEDDRVAIVVYAGAAGLVLPSTPVSKKRKILRALDELQAGGSTAGGAGIKLAYEIAKENLIEGGNNRVILATDGDFNVGASSDEEMVSLIEKKRKDDIFLTITGFGMDNYKGGKMEQISNAGNGNYFYIDNIREAEKVFVKEMRANMFTIAKDVKLQIEFNPTKVKGYRLIGYENRLLADEDFNDDTKDAGELGAGHTVTALYEIIPAGSAQIVPGIDELKYQKRNINTINTYAIETDEILTVKFRYKKPKGLVSKLIEEVMIDENIPLRKTSDNFRFSAAVAGFGMLLRDSKYINDLTYEDILKLAKNAYGEDENGYRQEFINLVDTCELLN